MVAYRWAKQWKEAVFAALHEYHVPRNFDARYVSIYLYTTRPQDYDNSHASIKAVLDGLKGHAIKDDKQSDIELVVKTFKVRERNLERVEIELSRGPISQRAGSDTETPAQTAHENN